MQKEHKLVETPCRLRVTVVSAAPASIDELKQLLRQIVERERSHVLVFPEMWITELVDPHEQLKDWQEAKHIEHDAREQLRETLRDLGVAAVWGGTEFGHISGEVISSWFTDPQGKYVFRYRKQSIAPGMSDNRAQSDPRFDIRAGQRGSPGFEFEFVCGTHDSICDVRAAILICSDIQQKQYVQPAIEHRPLIIFNPADMRPACTKEQAREAIEATHNMVSKVAQQASCWVIRAEYPAPRGLGSSAIVRPDGTLFAAQPLGLLGPWVHTVEIPVEPCVEPELPIARYARFPAELEEEEEEAREAKEQAEIEAMGGEIPPPPPMDGFSEFSEPQDQASSWCSRTAQCKY